MASCKYPLLMYDIVKLLWLFFYSLLQQFDKLSPSNSSSVLCWAVGADVYIFKPFVLLQELPPSDSRASCLRADESNVHWTVVTWLGSSHSVISRNTCLVRRFRKKFHLTHRKNCLVLFLGSVQRVDGVFNTFNTTMLQIIWDHLSTREELIKFSASNIMMTLRRS